MTVELRPLGVHCNIACQYCYQNPQRDAGNLGKRYDLEAMKRAVETEGGPFIIFGGEPLLVPEADLEDLWAWGLEKYGRNGIQTNGTLINDAHIRMFKKFKVHVGISIDGPGELNDVRWSGSLEKTRFDTAKTETAIERLCQEGIPPTLIVTLHRNNATNDKLPLMKKWFRKLDLLGIYSTRLHLLESENETIRNKYALSMEENIQVLLDFAELENELVGMNLDIFHDVEELLQGRDNDVGCVWRACDPYTTSAVRGVEGLGQSSNCGRTNKDGIDFVKSDQPGFERYIALYNTPQTDGGCQDCRFFLMCKGQCPGTSINGDWRNRTEHCDIWIKLFQFVEQQLLERGIEPLSVSPLRQNVERAILQGWAEGKNHRIHKIIKNLENGEVSSNNSIPDFHRISWVSNPARSVWQARIEAIVKARLQIFAHAIENGLYRCALLRLTEIEISECEERLKDFDDLQVIRLERRELFGNCCGKHHHIVIGKRDVVKRFAESWQNDDAAAMAEFLGVGECCLKFQMTVRNKLGLIDPTLAQAINSPDAKIEDGIVHQNSPGILNTLLNPLGILPLSHTPCSMHCRTSKNLAEKWFQTARNYGFTDEADNLEKLLSCPMEWSALHGIAEIKLPILKISANTDATAETYRIRIHSEAYPEEGIGGINYPFKRPNFAAISDSKAFKKGLANQIPDLTANRESLKITTIKTDTQPEERKMLGLRPRTSIILDETMRRLRERMPVSEMKIESVFLSNYFNVIRLENGSTGACANYFRFKSEKSVEYARIRLMKKVSQDPLLTEYFDTDGEPDLLNLSLKCCLVNALSRDLLLNPEGFQVTKKFDPAFFPPGESAVVIGFGGYMDYLIHNTDIKRIHISDLWIHHRTKSVQRRLKYYEEKMPEKAITFSDGSDNVRRIADADLVSITSSALCSGTLDQLLESGGKNKTFIVQGQSGSILPEVLFEKGVSLVSTTIKPSNLPELATADPVEFRSLLEGKLPVIYLKPSARKLFKNPK